MGSEAEKAWLMKTLVLDTDIFIDYLRGLPKAEGFFKQLKQGESLVYFSAITEAELLGGKECSTIEKKAALLNFLAHFAKVSVDNQVAASAGELRRNFSIEIPDAIIAATALLMKGELLTRNLKDYQKIADLRVRAPY